MSLHTAVLRLSQQSERANAKLLSAQPVDTVSTEFDVPVPRDLHHVSSLNVTHA